MKTEPMIKNVSLSLYFKRNNRYIIKNWRQEFIREKYNFSICQYIQAHIERLSDIFKIPLDHYMLQEWAGKMYKTL